MPSNQTIVLTLPDYKILGAETLLAKKFMEDNPDATHTDMASALGVTPRTLYRWASLHRVMLPGVRRKPKRKSRKTL